MYFDTFAGFGLLSHAPTAALRSHKKKTARWPNTDLWYLGNKLKDDLNNVSKWWSWCGVEHSCINRIRIWSPRQDECSGLMIGARGSVVLIGHKGGHAVGSQPKSPPVRASASTNAGTIGRIGRSKMYVDWILKLLFLHNLEYVYQFTSMLCRVHINITFAYVQIWKTRNIWTM